jgi:hypothetical protein
MSLQVVPSSSPPTLPTWVCGVRMLFTLCTLPPTHLLHSRHPTTHPRMQSRRGCWPQRPSAHAHNWFHQHVGGRGATRPPLNHHITMVAVGDQPPTHTHSRALSLAHTHFTLSIHTHPPRMTKGVRGANPAPKRAPIELFSLGTARGCTHHHPPPPPPPRTCGYDSHAALVEKWAN